MNQPFVQQLARGLGWGEPKFCTHRLTGKPATDYGAEMVEWAECRISDSFLLQINSLPQPFESYSLCVYAIRFQICSGWRYIRLTSDQRQRRRLLNKIAPYFELKHFETIGARVDYRRRFPYSQGYTWRRIQTEGAPHFTDQIS